MTKTLSLLFSILFISATIMAQNYQRTTLDDGWQLRSAEHDADPISAKVPGMVQEELIERGLMPDPYFGTNEKLVQWAGEQNWQYEHSWTQEEIDTDRFYQLRFMGLDTYAEVYLNDSLILEANNMFRSWEVPVNGILKTGENRLVVKLIAPIKVLAPQIEAFPYNLNKTAGNDTGELRMANFARKAQMQFGWDWGLRLVTMGIWRPVHLESWEYARLTDVQYFQDDIQPTVAKLSVEVQLDRKEDDQGQYELRVRGVENRQLYLKRPLMPEEKTVDLNFRIDRPSLWWPVGHGKPNRYHLACELWRNGELIDSYERKIGLRKVELVQRPDEHGTSFFFKINDRPIFIKGASYIPQDAVLTRITPEQKTELLVKAKDAHMNLIRIWGGGIYEDEHFYDQCDSLGLMVWQDFMFACAAYPSFSDFKENVEAEVRENIRRLRNHPSIIKWCGNNEVYLAIEHWGWQKQYDIHGKDDEAMKRSYAELFQELIPAILEEEDPARPYTHTTPLRSWAKPANYGHGTLHYWGVWHGPDDFSGYETKVGRYMNEYGFQSFPEMETIKAFTGEDESQWQLESPVMAHHQKSYIGNGLIGEFTEKYGEPADNFEDFVYQSQLVQYEGIRRAILAHRLRWGFCMGTTFWQLNDCWPGPSWSAIDYYGRHKVLFQELPNLYAPVVATAVGSVKQPKLAIMSDRPSAAEVLIQWSRSSMDGGAVLNSGERQIRVLEPGTQIIEPSTGMKPSASEITTIKLLIEGEVISTFKWSGKQKPIAMPEGDWEKYPALVE